jgi:anti-anti-sigma regulatory factor
VTIDMSRVPDIEYSALQKLVDTGQRAAALGVEWWLAALNPAVLEVVRRAGLAERLGRERMLFNARAAIERYRKSFLESGTSS